MDTPAPWLDDLQRLAAAEAVAGEALSPGGLEALLAQGLIERDERPHQASLEHRYEALQEVHRRIVEAKGCADRLLHRRAPRSRFAGLLGSGPEPDPEDPDAQQLHQHLEALRIQVRGVTGPATLPAHLDRVLDHLAVEGRDCLDRLAATDRELDQAQKQAPAGTQVEGAGFFRLTAAGEAALPESPVMELLEASLSSALAPGGRGASFPHVKEDPASLLSLIVDQAAHGARPSAFMAEYEALLGALERVPAYADLQPLRAKIAFLVRLLRATREAPKQAFFWAGREHLQALSHRIRTLLPPSVAATGWHLPYAADLFLADGGVGEDEAGHQARIQFLQAATRIQAEAFAELRVRDGQAFRLALVLAHAARVRQFTPGVLLDRFLRQAFEAIRLAAQGAPYDLGDRGTTLLFGAHLAHAAGFYPAKVPAQVEAFQALRARFEPHHALLRVPVQVQLHAFSTLDRLARLGAPQAPEAFEGLFLRLLKRLRHHKGISRAFSTAQIKAGDEAALVSNLCAQVAFRDLALPGRPRFHPDAGLAGLYEPPSPGHPPQMGSCFGTLLLV